MKKQIWRFVLPVLLAGFTFACFYSGLTTREKINVYPGTGHGHEKAIELEKIFLWGIDSADKNKNKKRILPTG